MFYVLPVSCVTVFAHTGQWAMWRMTSSRRRAQAIAPLLRNDGFVIAKFHYMGPTGPARTQRCFAAKKSVRVRAGPVGSV